MSIQSKPQESHGKTEIYNLADSKSVASSRPKSSEMTSGPGFRVRTCIDRPSAELVEQYRQFETTDVSDMLNRMFTMCPDLSNLSNDLPLVGPAVTVKVFPGDNLMLHKALDVAKPGDVLVVDTNNSQNNAVFGDLIANKAKHRGIAGLVIDGLIRDLVGVKETGLPVYARGVTAFGPLHRGPGELNYSVSCGGIVVNPGDIITADQSGVVVVRRDAASDILVRLTANAARMHAYIENVKRGKFSNDWVDQQLAEDQCLIEA
jgi:RraA family protein